MDVLARMWSAAFSLGGRTSRYDFWYFFTFLMLLGLFIVMLVAFLENNFGSMGASSFAFGNMGASIFAPVLAVYGILVSVLIFFAGVRRLRDAQYSTAWIALMFLGPPGWLILMRLWILPTSRRKHALNLGE